MDVLLDSNIYLEDLKMTGNQFAELFAYVRRTGSRLLLPDLVREEVATRYLERLMETSRKAQSAHDNLWKLSTSGGPQFKGPQFDEEVQSLLKRMQRPSKGVPVVEVDDYSWIDVKEVVRRGIHRKRPASEGGEELRDVILWLLTLTVAKNSPSGIAFISKDKTFAAEDGHTLHADLSEDVNSLGAPLDFYPGIREFVVAKALDHEPADADWFFSLVPLKKVQDFTTDLMLRSSTRVGNIVAADLKELEFERATRYKVGEHAYFIEASFHGCAGLSIEELPQYLNYVDVKTEPVAQQWTVGPMVPLQTIGYGWVENANLAFANAYSSWNLAFPSSGVFSANVAKAQLRKYVCSFRASFSARALDNKLESLEADAIQFRSFLPDEGERPGTAGSG